MKRPLFAFLLVGALGVAAAPSVFAQPPRGEGPPGGEGPEGPGRPFGPRGPGGPGGPGGPEGRMFRMPPSPLMTTLDVDGDGELSSKEIANATAALKTLDKDKNGKLTENELRPNFGRFGGPEPRGGGEAVITQLMAFDKNNDGKLSRSELPQRLQTLMDRADTNKDGVLDRAELVAISRQRGEAGGGPGFGRDRGPEGRGPEGRGSEGRGPEGGRREPPPEPPAA